MSRETDDKPLQSLALGVIGVIGGGIGGIGFITFAGGAIMLARFRGAGVPGVSAVGKMSRSDLLAIGADQLLAPLLFSLAAALILAFAYFRLQNRWMRLGMLVGSATGALAYYLLRSEPHIVGDNDQLLSLLGTVLILIVGVAAATFSGEREIQAERPLFWALAFGITILVTGAVVAGFATYALNLDEPHVQAAALARTGGKPPLEGIYVAESPTSVYIAEVERSKTLPSRGLKPRGQIVAVPRSDVAELRVGYFEPLPRALRHARRLARDLSAAPARP